MTPTEIRNEKMAAKIIKNLERRHIKGYYCPTAEEATRLVARLVEKGSTVTWGGSMTIRDMGIPAALHANETLTVYDRDLAETREEAQEIYRKAFNCNYYLSSVNAMSEDGQIVNVDGTGNRVAAITFGPEHVIFVVGVNKITQDVESAVKRARSTAGPINTARFNIETPCKIDGLCHNCNSNDCICNYIHILRNSPKGRHQVVIVGENLGY